MSKLNGELVLKDPIDEKEYRLRMDMNALADFEDLTGLNAMTELQDPTKLTAKVLRQFFWCLVKQNQPDADERTAGRLASIDALQQLFAVSAPVKSGEAGNGAAAGQ